MRRWRFWLAGLVGAGLAAWLGLHVYQESRADDHAFAQVRVRYEALAAQAPRADGRPRLLDWPWSETGAAIGAQTLRTLVYDESDEIGRKAPRPTAAWRARASAHLQLLAAGMDRRRDDDRVEVRPMGGHFYLVTETIQ